MHWGGLATSLVVATATAPIIGGISYFVVAPIATVNGYEEIEYSLDPPRVVFMKRGK